MEFYRYFDNINENSMKIIEANFVSRMLPGEFISLDKQMEGKRYSLNKFIVARSRSITAKSMQRANRRLTCPQILNGELNIRLRERSKSLPQNQYSKLKTQHSLQFLDFINLMKNVLQIPFKVSTCFFAKTCVPPGNEKNPNYVAIVDPENKFFQFDVANSIFAGCHIYWVDLLNVLTSKTTFVQPISEVKLIPRRTPKSFGHRLLIDQMQYLAELGVYFTSSRDGLVQFWAAENLSKCMKFQLVDNMDFGLKDTALEYICNKYHDLLDDPASRKTKINVMAKVRENDIPIDEIKDIEQEKCFIEGLPYTSVQTLTNPDHDASFMHIMQKGKQVEKVSLIIRACRATDDPLPSRRPLPDRVNRTVTYENKVYLCDQFNDDEEVTKSQRLSRQQVLVNRCRSCRVAEKTYPELDELYEVGFRDNQSLNTNDFVGKQHPIYGVKQGGRQRFRRGLYEKHAGIYKKEDKMQIGKEKQVCQNNNNWASCCCHYNNQIIVATISSKLLFYDITYKGLELKRYTPIGGIGIKQLIVWDRTLFNHEINKIGGKSHVVGCQDSELPKAGEKCTVQKCLIYICSNKIGVIHLGTMEEIGSITTSDVSGHRFSDGYYFENSEDENDSLDNYDNQNMYFMNLVVDNEKVFVSTSTGCVLKIQATTFKIEFIKKIINSDISALVWNRELGLLYVGGLNSQIKVYQYEQRLQLLQNLRDSGCILDIHISTRYGGMISVCSSGVVTVWSLRQYTQLLKTFVNEQITVSSWNEETSVLLLGCVAIRAYKLVGAQAGDGKQHGLVPQAHFMPVVALVNIEPEKLSEEDLTNRYVTQFVEQVGTKDNTETEVTTSDGNKVRPHYKRGNFRRRRLDFTIVNTALPNQPNYEPLGDGRAPYIDYRFQDPEVQVHTMRYSRQASRGQLVEHVALHNYRMLDFTQYIRRVETEDGHVARARRYNNSSKQTTGIELLQLAMASEGSIAPTQVPRTSGFITVDVDGNLRQWDLSCKIISTFKLDIPEKVNVSTAVFHHSNRLLIVALSNGQCLYFDVLTHQTINVIKPSLCAKAAYLLQFDGATYAADQHYTEEFQRFLATYKPQNYSCIASMTIYQQSVACAVGNYVLLFNLASTGSNAQQNLSKRLVEHLLAQNSQEAVALASGVTQPPQMILQGHLANIIAINAVGRKLVTADENGTICCWVGQGIAKQVVQVREDQILRVYAMQEADLWCGMILKNGVVQILDKAGTLRRVCQIQYNGVSDLNLIFEQPSEMHLKEGISAFKILITDITNLILLEYNIKEQHTRVLGYYRLKCGCRSITAAGFFKDGTGIFIGDTLGHCYQLGDLTNIKQLDYLTKNPVVAKKDENEEVADNMLQYLYEAKVVDDNLLYLQRNGDFDGRFDDLGLLDLQPMSLGRCAGDSGIGTPSGLIRPETKEFLANLREIQDVVLEDRREDLFATYKSPATVRYSQSYVQDQLDRIYQLDKHLRLGLGSSVK